jgi:hypothetical protein
MKNVNVMASGYLFTIRSSTGPEVIINMKLAAQDKVQAEQQKATGIIISLL